MSEASRAAALQHAAALFHGSANPEAVLETAEAFHAFIVGGGEAPAKATPAKAAAKATPAKAAAKAIAQPESDEDAITKEQVGESIEAMLNADMRKQAIALFAKYGAKSLSGVKTEDYASIKQDADDALLNA
jgi:alkanesulfonate monooxygenase SsuD/methylene tetrahydromethanopterin reductase-like flavin-dependent oxidoreductase (luciferase family)